MRINGVEIDDTFAEAFKMWGTRLIITAVNRRWAQTAGQVMTGFATSVIGCGCEAGIEEELDPAETPDGRPGVSVLFFVASSKTMEEQLMLRVGQAVMTCPTSACFSGLHDGERFLKIGGRLRYFGDGFQSSKLFEGRRLWRIPVMDGEFLIDEKFSMTKSVGGGNLLLVGKDGSSVLEAAEAAVSAMKQVPGVIMPFPGGIVRSGSKVGARYKFLTASTNTAFCPTLRGQVESQLPEGANAVLEIVVNGLTEAQVRQAMRVGMEAACRPGVMRITAGNYGGQLGQYHIYLRELQS